MPSQPQDNNFLSIVVPVCNEADSIISLITEIHHVLDGLYSFQIFYVNDASTDQTLDRLREAKRLFPALDYISFKKRSGQSQAIASGIRHAKGPIIVTLDGDGQNDPTDIPMMVDRLLSEPEHERDYTLISGHRHKRQDTLIKRLSSLFANRMRAKLLHDSTPDSGCGLKVFTKNAFLDIPRFDHMHRFIPALMLRRKAKVITHPIHHRPREKGQSKYGLWDRLWVGIIDILGVMWLQRRTSNPDIDFDGRTHNEK